MPFESKGTYRDLLVAYVAGLAGLGFTARTVLEVSPHEPRLERLRKIIGQCGSSIHDLSCVARTAGCPRFNMPFELGLVVADPRARWFVFEKEPHRLQKTLSDVNGHDPLIHRGKPNVVIAKLRGIFHTRQRVPTVQELLTFHTNVRKLARAIEAVEESLLGPQPFVDLVVGAQELARRHGLI